MTYISNKTLTLSVLAVLSLATPNDAFSTTGPSMPANARVGSTTTALQPLHSSFDSNDESNYPNLDWDAFEKKNVSRKKFGLKSMTPEEFLDNEAQIRELEIQQQMKAAAISAAAAEMTQQKNNQRQRRNNGPNFLDKLFGGNDSSDKCESNFDCSAPLVCCDFGFERKCCSSGKRSREGELALVPVPVETIMPGQIPRRY